MQEPTQPTQPTQPTTGARPTGITVLAILAAIGGVFAILGGLALIGLGGLAAASGAGLGAFGGILGLLFLVLGALELVLAYGFWTLKPWAWTLGVGLQGASIALALLQFVNNTAGIMGLILSLAISGVILYYLFQPHVKAAFGRA